MFPTNILGSLGLARRGLVSQQIVLDTIGHNLANAATPGYTRQRAELEPVMNRGGVDVAGIRRLRDRFLDAALLGEQQILGRNAARESVLQRLQGLVNDAPGAGLGASIDALFASFQDLSVTPGDQTLRAAVRDRAGALAAGFREMDRRIDQLAGDVTTDIAARVERANALMASIADAHRDIIASRGGPAPNDLYDRRDALVAELASIIGVTPLDRPDGSVQLAMTGSGVLLVDGTAVAPLGMSLDVATDTVRLTAGATAIPVTPKTGALASLLELRNSPAAPLVRTRAELDALAAALIEQVNRVHAGGAGLSGHATLASAYAVTSSAAPLDAAGLPFAPGSGSVDVIVHDAAGAVVSTVTVPIVASVTTLDDLRTALDADPSLTATVSGGALTITAAAGRTFVLANDGSGVAAALGLNAFFTGRDATDIAVSAGVAGDPNLIAAARADAAGLVHPGDGANALALARLRTAAVLGGGTATLGEGYAAIVGRIGSDARDAIDARDHQQATVELVQGMQQQASGVSTDEELISLTQAQTAYAAAARFATAINDVIGTLLGMAT